MNSVRLYIFLYLKRGTAEIINNSVFEEKDIIEEIINSKFNKIFNAQQIILNS